MEQGCPIDGTLKYVRHSSYTDKIYDHLSFLRPLQWLWVIIDNRSKYNEDMTQLIDNDIRNGVFALTQIHNKFGPCNVVVLEIPHVCLPMFPLSHPSDM